MTMFTTYQYCGSSRDMRRESLHWHLYAVKYRSAEESLEDGGEVQTYVVRHKYTYRDILFTCIYIYIRSEREIGYSDYVIDGALFSFIFFWRSVCM